MSPKYHPTAYLCCFLQIVFFVLFGVFTRYDVSDSATTDSTYLFPQFQDVNVMIFVGFGFLMTFLCQFGWNAVNQTLLVGVVSIQWAFLICGFIAHQSLADPPCTDFLTHGERPHRFLSSSVQWTSDSTAIISLGVSQMLSAEFATATVLISMGAVLGVASPFQLIVMGIVEIVVFSGNDYIGRHLFHAVDIGDSIFLHMFGAYFGLAVSRFLANKQIPDHPKRVSNYTSDLYVMVGSLFLWIFWPSFNGGTAVGVGKTRAYLNTFLSLLASTTTTFATSSLLHPKGKYSIVHIQNATLAGGVAMGAVANFALQPWGAILMGSVAGIISTFGYFFLTPHLENVYRISDTCGVHNLHGMPAVLSGVASAISAAVANQEDYVNNDDLYSVFPNRAPLPTAALCSINPTQPFGHNWSASKQGGMQMAALATTLGFALVGGSLTGLLLRFLPKMCRVDPNEFFSDIPFWEIEGQVEIDVPKRATEDTSESPHSRSFSVKNVAKSRSILTDEMI